MPCAPASPEPDNSELLRARAQLQKCEQLRDTWETIKGDPSQELVQGVARARAAVDELLTARQALKSVATQLKEARTLRTLSIVNALGTPIDFRDWVVWRARNGTRPNERATMCKEESALWRDTMHLLFGEGWRLQTAPLGSGVRPGVPVPGEPRLDPWADYMQQSGRGADDVPRSGPVAEVDGWPLVALSQPGRRADGSEA